MSRMVGNGFKYLIAMIALGVVAVQAAAPFLWVVEGDELDVPQAYLFGTIHLPNPEVSRLTERIEAKLASSDVFMGELEMSDQAMAQMVPKLMLPAGQSLRVLLPAELYARTDRVLRSFNPLLSMDVMNTMQIWAIATGLPVIREQLRYPLEVVLDQALYNYAVAAGLEVGGLETIEEQIAVFDQFSSSEQIQMLEATVGFFEDEAETGRNYVGEMLQWYLSGDEAGFDVLLKDFGHDDPDLDARFMKALLYERNRVMADRIAMHLQAQPEKRFFFAIGAGHFFGETGIQRLLAEKGLVVRRIAE